MPVFVALKGGKRVGKSAVAEALRAAAGSDYPECDIEYSDLHIAIANLAICACENDLANLERELLRAIDTVLRTEVAGVRLDEALDKVGRLRLELVRRDLLDHFRDRPPVRLTRENKDEHRPILSWIGVIGSLLLGMQAFEREIERRAHRAHMFLQGRSGIVTIGGVRRPGEEKPATLRGGFLVEVRSQRAQADTDPANSMRDLLTPSVIIHNDVDGLDQLADFMQTVWADLRHRRPQPVYRPS